MFEVFVTTAAAVDVIAVAVDDCMMSNAQIAK